MTRVAALPLLRQAGAWLLGCAFATLAAAQEAATVAPAQAPPQADVLRHPSHPHKPAPSAPAHKTSPYHGMQMSAKARAIYPAAWGVDHLRVSHTASGNLIRFSYRVVDPRLAKPLGDHEATPYLYAPRTHAMLQVPTMEKVGQLRQLGASEADKEYWMVFSNKGNPVRPGDRVNVSIGRFHADGLLVE
jgi:hypothetical protein